MKRFLNLLLVLAVALSAAAYRHQFRTVPNDPLSTLQYTLPNGLEIFMTVNKEKPRIQTYIPVRVGSKNDPAETTGLAHYFEHMMFKGTKNFGTQDYAAEEPLLNEIERLFEVYRSTTDSAARAAIYHKIDSVSYAASLIAIPNEYDKLMSAIGASGSNAYTAYDVTCYVEDIPSNQVDNWAMIQADRFANPVLRGFHTELETIYEEKNMSLTRDFEKCFDALLNMLFPDHPYGQQTILGSQEHLKNPSITNIKKAHDTWYVPNNMAICLSGDFDPDRMVDVIEKYFGKLKPNPNLKRLDVKPQTPLTAPLTRTVLGLESPGTFLAWSIPAANTREKFLMEFVSSIIFNGKCGLFDLNINLPQKMLQAGAFNYPLTDRGMFVAYGMPGTNQSLEEVRDLLLAEVRKVAEGKFSDELLQAVKNNYKSMLQSSFEDNSERANYYVDAFVNDQPWADCVAQFNDVDAVTRQDVIDVAKRFLGDNNYAAVFKEQGKDTTQLKIPKAKLTPIATNRDKSSEFLRKVQATRVEPIEPVFLDFSKDLNVTTTADAAKLPLLYRKNNVNDLFSLTFKYDLGSLTDKPLAVADFLDKLGTSSMSAAELQTKFYDLACSYKITPSLNNTYVTIRGLAENMDKALDLYETFVADAVVDTAAWNTYLRTYAEAAQVNKADQSYCFRGVRNYARYGGNEKNPYFLSEYLPDELSKVNPEDVTAAVRRLGDFRHTVMYYGPESVDNVKKSLKKHHRTAATLKEAPAEVVFTPVENEETVFYLAPYDSKQLYMPMQANNGELYDPALEPARQFYNEYFGYGMNAIVFQELRESRSLAYSASAAMAEPDKKGRPYTYATFIATQNDKMGEAIDAFNDIINNMPESESAWQLAKEGADSRLRTERTEPRSVAWAYIDAQKHGLDYDMDRVLFEKLPSATLKDIVDFQKKHVKGQKYSYAILGNIEDLDLDKLRSMGRVVILTLEDVLGY